MLSVWWWESSSFVKMCVLCGMVLYPPKKTYCIMICNLVWYCTRLKKQVVLWFVWITELHQFGLLNYRYGLYFIVLFCCFVDWTKFFIVLTFFINSACSIQIFELYFYVNFWIVFFWNIYCFQFKKFTSENALILN
jgi:hypothetical protein